MIQSILYDKCANTQAGRMGYELRIVGQSYHLYGAEDSAVLKLIREELHRDQKVLVLTYDNDMQQVIIDRGVEKILKTL